MRRETIAAMTSVCALAFAAFLLPFPGWQAQAQTPQSCKVFHGMVQGVLPTPYQFADTDTWGGPLYVTLGAETLIGGVSGNDGKREGTAMFRDGVYKVCFGAGFFGGKWGGPSDCYHSFTYKVPTTVVSWPSANLLGLYKAVTAEIVPGTGRFQSVSGHLIIVGPFITWPDATSRLKASGRWNGELNGVICGVQ